MSTAIPSRFRLLGGVPGLDGQPSVAVYTDVSDLYIEVEPFELVPLTNGYTTIGLTYDLASGAVSVVDAAGVGVLSLTPHGESVELRLFGHDRTRRLSTASARLLRFLLSDVFAGGEVQE